MEIVSPFVYVGSAYSHQSPIVRQLRFTNVAKFCAAHMQTFRAPLYSPIVHFHPIDLWLGDEEAPQRNAAWWRPFWEPMLRASQGLVVYADDEGAWKVSEGLELEVSIAHTVGIPVTVWQMLPDGPVNPVFMFEVQRHDKLVK